VRWLFIVVLALGCAAVYGVDVAAGLDLEEVARAGDRIQGTMEFKQQGHSPRQLSNQPGTTPFE
jgi:hypothetical protein